MLEIALVVGSIQNHCSRPHEARQVVEWRRFSSLKQPLPSQNHLADTPDRRLQVFLDLLAAQGWITVGIEQAFFGDQHRALAIDVQGRRLH